MFGCTASEILYLGMPTPFWGHITRGLEMSHNLSFQ